MANMSGRQGRRARRTRTAVQSIPKAYPPGLPVRFRSTLITSKEMNFITTATPWISSEMIYANELKSPFSTAEQGADRDQLYSIWGAGRVVSFKITARLMSKSQEFVFCVMSPATSGAADISASEAAERVGASICGVGGGGGGGMKTLTYASSVTKYLGVRRIDGGGFMQTSSAALSSEDVCYVQLMIDSSLAALGATVRALVRLEQHVEWEGRVQTAPS